MKTTRPPTTKAAINMQIPPIRAEANFLLFFDFELFYVKAHGSWLALSNPPAKSRWAALVRMR